MRVETSVAIEFAVSCRPLRKSNASATAIKPIKRGRLSSTVMARFASQLIDHDRIYLVRYIFEPIDNFFQMIVEFGADNKLHRAAFIALQTVRKKQRFQPSII